MHYANVLIKFVCSVKKLFMVAYLKHKTRTDPIVFCDIKHGPSEGKTGYML
jgi:hypothetical protein